MVMFLLLLSLLVFDSGTVPVHASDLSFKGGADMVGSYVFDDSSPLHGAHYSAAPYLQVSYSSSALKADFRGTYTIQGVDAASSGDPGVFSLDKAYFKFRFPGLLGKRLTVTAGLAPISWGLGYYYRAGDVLFEDPIINTDAGTYAERQLWLVSINQPLGAGFNIDFAFLPALGETTNEKFGILLRKDFGATTLKEMKAAYAYALDGTHKAAIVADLFLYFDITLGVESSFSSSSDVRIVANAMKQFSLESETHSCPLTVFASSQLDFFAACYSVAGGVSFGVNDRLTVSANGLGRFSDSSEAWGLGVGGEMVLVDGVSASFAGLYADGFPDPIYPDGLSLAVGLTVAF